jgi:DNA-binding IclR family transcriptional regulator
MGEQGAGVGVTDLARLIGLHKSTASRLLSTLQRRGLVCQDPGTGRYRLGPAMARLGCQAESGLNVGVLALDELVRLAQALGETVSLEVRVGSSLARVAYADASGCGRLRGTPNLPLHATAGGKLLLAYGPERDVARLARNRLFGFTPATVVELGPLLRELMLIRKRGYASAFGELDPRVNSLAVPVFDQRSSVVAAVEVHGPALRITASRLPQILTQAEECSDRIMRRIGGLIPCSCTACSSRSSSAVVDWARHVAMEPGQRPDVEDDSRYEQHRERWLSDEPWHEPERRHERELQAVGR